jgi:TolB protein
MNADGSAQTPLTKLTAAKLQCCLDLELVWSPWSPDGSKIVFGSSRALDGSDTANINSISNIWVMNADGSAQTPLTKLTAPNVYSVGPVWSPDGSKIAFTSARALDGSDTANINSISNIWVMNADGSAQTPLTKLTQIGAASGPVWSPNGSKIAFISTALPGYDPYPGYRNNIWVMNADGSAQNALTKLTAPNVYSEEPAWSRDGSKIAFTSSRALDGSDAANINNSTSNIWVMNADGSAQTPLTKLTQIGAASGGAVWSRDGGKIAFGSERTLDGTDGANINFIWNVWVMNPDGSAQTPLTKLTAGNAGSRGAVWRQ